MGGIANNPQVQQAMQLGQSLQQPGQVPVQGGFNPGTPFQKPLPEGYQSPYANYGFDPGLQSYLDNQYLGSMTDAGVNWNYDPTNQTFTGGTMGGTYNPIPLSVMQQAAGGNRDVLNPYFQSRFPQPTTPPPTIKPGPVRPPNMPSAGVAPNPAYAKYENPMSSEQLQQWIAQLPPMPGLGTTYGLGGQPYPGQPRPQQPMQFPRFGQQIRYQQQMPGQVRPQNMPFYQNPNPGTYGAVNNNGVTAQTPDQPQQRGLGGLQLNKFRNRLG